MYAALELLCYVKFNSWFPCGVSLRRSDCTHLQVSCIPVFLAILFSSAHISETCKECPFKVKVGTICLTVSVCSSYSV